MKVYKEHYAPTENSSNYDVTKTLNDVKSHIFSIGKKRRIEREKELEEYLNAPVASIDTDVLLWWKVSLFSRTLFLLTDLHSKIIGTRNPISSPCRHGPRLSCYTGWVLVIIVKIFNRIAYTFTPLLGTSVPIERAFSSGRNLVTYQRACLTPETIRRCMCLKSWWNSVLTNNGGCVLDT